MGLRRSVSAAFVFYVFAATGVIGCENPAARAPQAAQITLIGPGADDPRWRAIVAGARWYARDFEWAKIVALNPIEPGEAAFRHAIYEALRARPAAVCVMCANPAWISVDQFIDAGARLITIDVRVDDGRVAGEVDLHALRAAELLGESLPRLAGDGRTYVLLHEQSRNPRARDLLEHFEGAVRNLPEPFRLEDCDLSRSGFPADETMLQIRARFPRLSLMVSLTPSPWIGADTGRLLGEKARFATLGGAPCFWSALREEQCAGMIARLDGAVGRAAIELAIAAITEPSVETRRRVIEPRLVTRDNLDPFAAEYAAAAGLSVAECEQP